jgi:DNA (cytosine-5)-methyltransferase 1
MNGRDKRAAFSDRYYKLSWDKPSNTITAHMSHDGYRYIYPDSDQPRTLTPREAARVQSFPDSFRFAGFRSNAYRQIGNAVPPLLSEAIARSVLRELRGPNACEPADGVWQLAFPPHASEAVASHA